MSKPAIIKKIPGNPGVYLMKDKDARIIYIGKAKNLKKRVSSYFEKKLNDYKTSRLVKRIKDIEYIITDTEVEALLLEAKLIRQHRPKFNLDLKDSHRYPYLKITNEKFPRIIVARRISNKGEYFGPFTDGAARTRIVKMLNKIFKLRVCQRLPKKVCLYYHLGYCGGPCENKILEKEYLKNIDRARMFLKGKNEVLIRQLYDEMEAHASKQEYELAQEKKEQIEALLSLREDQKVNLPKSYDQDAVNYLKKDRKMIIQVFKISRGVISGRRQFILEDQPEVLPSFLKQYYFTHKIPKEIILPEEIADQELIEDYLSALTHLKIRITVPQKGTKRKILDLIEKNLWENLSVEEKAMRELQRLLDLPALPRHIECFDISNLKDKYAVGSSVHFADSKPDKNQYRKYKIKTVKGQNDYAMLWEVVSRRYYRLKKEGSLMPDLIVIDGGKGQLNIARRALENLSLEIPMIGLAKKFEEIYQTKRQKPLRLSRQEPALQLLIAIRDEAHRFAVKYNRELRQLPADRQD